MNDYSSFFRQATGGHPDGGYRPYPYQLRFAERPEMPLFVKVPTAAGKTAAAVLGWLYRRRVKPAETPRRLVYCLPMRVLVEQTVREIQGWLNNLRSDTPLYILMGGVEAEEWYLEPEREAVIVGTQDMLLSRALNRGYGASRFHWPVDFGLLNNDALWVFDEPQLMGNGVSTSAQLAVFRQMFGTFGPCASLWMSATLERSWLETVDAKGRFEGEPLELAADEFGDDYEQGTPLFERMTAKKTLKELSNVSTKDAKKFASEVLRLHEEGTQTLVILNTVERAVKVAKALDEEGTKRRRQGVKTLLIHSRFRPCDRKNIIARMEEKEQAVDRIIVSTQVVEAGVNISARTLVTEIAPWSSVVQRIGRCNRTGKDGPGMVYWVNLETKDAPPYEKGDIEKTRERLSELEGCSVSPRALDDFMQSRCVVMELPQAHVVRKRDMIDLFDTTPDLAGNDIDIQRFVRGIEKETDVQVFWRENPNGEDIQRPVREELCSVPVGSFKKFLENKRKSGTVARVWDHLDGEWREIRGDLSEIRPGITALLDCKDGGYTTPYGWDGESTEKVAPVPRTDTGGTSESVGSDPKSSIPRALTIAEHSKDVLAELEGMLNALGGLGIDTSAILDAARYHDVGKAHPVFQNAVRGVNETLDTSTLWAKSGSEKRIEYERKHFRHELASALALAKLGLPFVVSYLVAAHHGRVRLSIRSMPDEEGSPGTLFALGIREGDVLPEIDLGFARIPSVAIDLLPMRLGSESSWVANAWALLKESGPFRLAYLEALLRAADARASKKEAGYE